MTYDKFTMYLATIPDYDTDDENDKGGSGKSKKTGSVNLFDIDER